MIQKTVYQIYVEFRKNKDSHPTFVPYEKAVYTDVLKVEKTCGILNNKNTDELRRYYVQKLILKERE